MSTDLYGVRVLKIEPSRRRVRFRVFVVYYDTRYENHQPIPEDHSFFFRILWDEADTRFGGGGPLGEEVDVDSIGDEAFVDANTWRYIASVRQLAVRNHPIEDWDSYHDFYYERDGRWVDEEKLVQADYDVFVTDEKYLTHLQVGMSWGTTSYETEADHLHLDETLPDLRSPVATLIPFSGEADDETPADARFSPCGRHLVCASDAGEFVCYAVEDHAEIWRSPEIWDGEDEDLRPAIQFSADGKHVYRYGYLSGWRLADGHVVTRATTDIDHRAFSPKRTRQIDYGYGSALKLGAIDEDGNPEDTMETGFANVEACDLFQDEVRAIIGGSGRDEIHIVDLQEKTVLRTIPVSGRVSALTLSPDERYVAVCMAFATGRPRMSIVRLEDGRVTRRHLIGDAFVGPFDWAPDMKTMALTLVNASNGFGGRIALYHSLDVAPPISAEDDPNEPLDQILTRLRRERPPLSPEALDAALTAHQTFLDAGGGGGWEDTTVFGLALTVGAGHPALNGQRLVLRYANLKDANLRDRDLSWADLTGCLLDGADLRGAKFEETRLDGVDLSRTIVQ